MGVFGYFGGTQKGTWGDDDDDDDIRPGPGIPWHSNTQRECHSRNAGMEHSPGSPLMSIIIIKKTGLHADDRDLFF